MITLNMSDQAAHRPRLSMAEIPAVTSQMTATDQVERRLRPMFAGRRVEIQWGDGGPKAPEQIVEVLVDGAPISSNGWLRLVKAKFPVVSDQRRRELRAQERCQELAKQRASKPV